MRNRRVEIAEHIDAIRRHGEALATAADRAGLDAPVPTCPPWQVKDLLRHTGYIHRWAARHITERPAEVLNGAEEAEILRGGSADDELLAWFRVGHTALVETLSSADPGLQTATFMAAPSPLAFWARRQAHETAVHRVDAERASGVIPGFPADFAADGIDELVMGFGSRHKYQPRSDVDGTLRILATDTSDDWYVQAQDGRFHLRRPSVADGTSAADGAVQTNCTVSGPAAGLYVFLWNRSGAAQADVAITGDAELLERWKSSVRVRWG